MEYVEGFVIAVPTANREQFIAHARHFDRLLIENGALRVVEGWGHDVPRGQHTDFRGAVKATDDETVCFSWIEWPDRATRDACHARMEELMKSGEWAAVAGEHGEMPFDGKRMIFGGFVPIVDAGEWTPDAYVQGFVLPVTDREAYRQMAADAWNMFAGYGALQVVECWQDDVPHGQQTDFYRAVKAEPNEHIVFSWMTWPSREVCDAAAAKMQSDDSMKIPDVMPFDLDRMIVGGFVPVVDLPGEQ